ncbi:MAG: tetratricopeptide repeat protein [Oligoflexales bacterium]
MGWLVVKSTPSPMEAVKIIKSKEAYVLIIDDNLEEPSANMIRYLMLDPIIFGTPIFTFLLEDHKFEGAPLAYMGFKEMVAKPLTPSKFIPNFKALLKRWESKPMMALRGIFYRYFDDNNETKLRDLLGKLINVESTAPIVSPIIATLLMQAGKLQEAERILLEKIKTNPKNLRSVLTLGNLYLQHSMPHVAKRLFLNTHKQFEGSCCLLPDIVQAEIMLCNLESALEVLEQMANRKYMLDKVQPFMARVAFALGRKQDAEDFMGEKKGIFHKIERSWSEIA